MLFRSIAIWSTGCAGNWGSRACRSASISVIRAIPMTIEAEAVTVDARGMRCPWPALRLARAMRSAARVRLIADDHQAGREIAGLAERRRVGEGKGGSVGGGSGGR